MPNLFQSLAIIIKKFEAQKVKETNLSSHNKVSVDFLIFHNLYLWNHALPYSVY